MRVDRGRTYVTSELTVDEDLDFLTLWQAKRLASPASDEALRKGNQDITNAEIADAANIAISKLVDDYLPEVLLTAQGDIIVRGASLPERLAKITTGQFLKATATGYEGSAIPSPLTVAETEVWNGSANTPTAWTDLDISAVVGSNVALVLLKISFGANDTAAIYFRLNGDAELTETVTSVGAASRTVNEVIYLLVIADASGIIEWITGIAATGLTIDVVAYVK